MKGTEAIDHIRDEMAAATDGRIEAIGEMMTLVLQAHPETEIAEGKTLKGAFDAMYDRAKKSQKGGFFAFAPGEAFAEVMKYYGLGYGPKEFYAIMCGEAKPQAIAEVIAPKKAAPDPFDLDALMEG